MRLVLVIPGISTILRRLREGLSTCKGQSMFVTLLRDLISGVRLVHNQVVSMLKKARH